MKYSFLDIPPCPECGCARRIDENFAMTYLRVSCGCRWCNSTEREEFSFRMLGRGKHGIHVTDDNGFIIAGARSEDV